MTAIEVTSELFLRRFEPRLDEIFKQIKFRRPHRRIKSGIEIFQPNNQIQNFNEYFLTKHGI
jgi:hypothetical protein